jgi:hypothetical protein
MYLILCILFYAHWQTNGPMDRQTDISMKRTVIKAKNIAYLFAYLDIESYLESDIDK